MLWADKGNARVGHVATAPTPTAAQVLTHQCSYLACSWYRASPLSTASTYDLFVIPCSGRACNTT